MQVVKMLLLGLIVLYISGCAQVPLKCTTPDVAYPDINNSSCGTDVKCVYEKVVGNYYKMQEYAEKLEESNRVCK